MVAFSIGDTMPYRMPDVDALVCDSPSDGRGHNDLGCARLLILLAWERGELSEGQVSKYLGLDPVTAREVRERCIRQGKALAQDRAFVYTRCFWRHVTARHARPYGD